MTEKPYDVAILGLGGMGSATAAHAVARGLRVIGLERFGEAHALGSSHGKTRLIRMAYFEGDDYVPLLRRAYELWDDLERRTKTTVRSRTGALFVGDPSTPLIDGTLRSARANGLVVEVLDRAALSRTHPAVRALSNEIGVFEPAAGTVFPEAAVSALLRIARDAGAELRFETAVRGWEHRGGEIVIALEGGERIEARKLVVCAGAWLGTLLSDLFPLEVERNVQVWFDPLAKGAFGPDSFFPFAVDRGREFFYGFPDFGDGIKCAFHHTGQFTTPQSIDRSVSVAEIERARKALDGFLPGAAGTHRAASVCMYTLTPDEHFVLGPHPGQPNVFVASGFSGHGFKFCPVVGEIMANYAATGAPGHPIEMFSPTRFSGAKRGPAA